MKQGLRWGLGLLVLIIGGGVAGIPVFTGSMAEMAYRSGIEDMNQRLDANPELSGQIEITQYDRGLYSSSVVTRYSLQNPMLDFDVVQEMQHGFAGARFEGHAIPRGRTREVMEQLGGGDDTIRFNGRYGTEDVEFVVMMDALSGVLDVEPDVQLNLQPLQIDGQMTHTGESVRVDMDWGGLAMRSLSTPDVIEMGQARGQLNAKLIAGDTSLGVWDGDFGLDIARLNANVDEAESFAIEAIALAGRTDVNEQDRIDSRFTLSFESLTSMGMDPIRGSATLRSEGLLVEPLLELANQAEQLGDDAPYERLLADAIAQGVTLYLTEGELAAGPQRRLSADAELVIKPEMADLLRAGLMSFAMLEAMDFEMNVGLDQALANSLPRELGVWLAQMRAFGVLRAQDDRLELNIRLQDGEVLVHGEPWG
ncbi:DUF945 family protein [Spiribacter sp. C176]|uniref:DUF945 family protein n=1 Tax=Spiribacter salilacus TaxID=2664894 RepID=A0A6N7QN31_9GAMM|nr:DUF945 family protein [Spiribacter salilacus]MRH77811.1 DUF945 family protein [Spiribacter salilacus]